MVNANAVAAELAMMLPQDERPETTEGYQGFFHLLGIQASVEQARMSYIIRDHDRDRFEDRKRLIQSCAEQLNDKYGEGTVVCEVRDQYYNMKEKIDPEMHVIDLVLHAMQACEVAPKVKPIRGGTDGAQLSFRGLPCPNIFAGGVNFHGPYEFVSIQVMEKAMQVIVKICQLVGEYKN
jgi:tripeptide aminopeptidase